MPYSHFDTLCDRILKKYYSWVVTLGDMLFGIRLVKICLKDYNKKKEQIMQIKLISIEMQTLTSEASKLDQAIFYDLCCRVSFRTSPGTGAVYIFHYFVQNKFRDSKSLKILTNLSARSV
jgi:hypothetical protein